MLLNNGTSANLHCGASIAHSKFLITSAHCVDSDHYDVKKMTVLLGSEDIQVGTLGQMYLLKLEAFFDYVDKTS